MNETYNGYKNRSTWLVKLHLDNTDESVYKDALKLGKRYDDMINYWEDIKKRDSSSYSYPFHQHKGLDNSLIALLRRTKISDEVNYRFYEVDKDEVYKALRDEIIAFS